MSSPANPLPIARPADDISRDAAYAWRAQNRLYGRAP